MLECFEVFLLTSFFFFVLLCVWGGSVLFLVVLDFGFLGSFLSGSFPDSKIEEQRLFRKAEKKFQHIQKTQEAV